MIDSAPSFARRESQTDFSNQIQPQQDDSDRTRQQSTLSGPRIQSKPLKPSTSSSGHWKSATEFPDQSDEYDYTAEQVRVAKESLNVIRQRINSLNDAGELDVDALISLFGSIKRAQKQGYIDSLRDYSCSTSTTLSGPLATLLKRFATDIDSEKFSLAGLNGSDVHQLFNGFSVIVGESPRDSLLSSADFNRIRNSLRQSTEALLTYAHDEQIFQKQWDSTQLINSLNWLSRGLKQGVLSAKAQVIKRSFLQALKTMKNWVPGDGDAARTTTSIEPLDTRQLGKCLVQISTAMKFSLIDLNEHGALLKEIVLGLCGGHAVKQFTLWQRDPNTSERKLTAVSPEGTELTNISNTIKDCLRQNILDLGDLRVQRIVDQLCGHLYQLPERALLERRGQRLANGCNLLREVSEWAQATGRDLSCLGAYQKACARMLELIPRLIENLSLDTLAEQSVANLLSFVKAMDKTRQQSTTLLRAAAASLVSVLPQMATHIENVDSVLETLGGLQHIGQRNLAPVAKVINAMLAMVNNIDPKQLPNWPAISRVVLMRAAVYLWEYPPMHEAPPDALRKLLQPMQVLLAMPVQAEDRLDYLKAASVLIRQDPQWLDAHQSLLRDLMPELRGDTISQDDVAQSLKRLQSKAAATEVLAEPEPEVNQSKPAVVPPAVAAKVQVSPPVHQRPVVGMTRLIDTSAQPITMKTTATATATTGATTTTTAQSGQPARSLQTDSWQTPTRVVKASRSELARPDVSTAPILLGSTEPVLVTRSEIKPESASKPAVRASQKKPAMNETVSNKAGNKPNNKSGNKPNNKASQAKSQPDRRLPPEQEWFQLLKGEQRWSAQQQKRLEELLKATPALAMSTEGKGRMARSALFYAISTGKAEAVRLIMGAASRQDLSETVIQVVVETLMVGDQELDALTVCLSQLSKPELETLRIAIGKKYSKSEILKNIASGFLSVFEKFGLNFKVNKNQMPNAAKIHVKVRADNPLPKPVPDRSDTPPLDTSSLQPSSRIIFNPVPAPVMRFLIAAYGGDVSTVISLLKTASADEMALGKDSMGCNALLMAAAHGYVDIVIELMKLKSIDEQTRAVDQFSGANALMAAASNDHAKVVKALLTLSSAESMARATDHRGMNALIRAANRGSVGVIKLLLEMASADEQAAVRDKKGLNALSLSAGYGDIGIIELLTNMKTGDQQALSTDNMGENALMHAAKKGHVHVLPALLMMTSNVQQFQAKNANNLNALDLAIANGHTEFANFLTGFWNVRLDSGAQN